MSEKDNIAKMTIDLNRSRFRIHQETLKKLGNPMYIQFLVNTEEMLIAVLGSDRPLAGGTANKVQIIREDGSRSVEFYSSTLLRGIYSMIGLVDTRYSYRLTGEVDRSNRVAYFSMNTIKRNKRNVSEDEQGV